MAGTSASPHGSPRPDRPGVGLDLDRRSSPAIFAGKISSNSAQEIW